MFQIQNFITEFLESGFEVMYCGSFRVPVIVAFIWMHVFSILYFLRTQSVVTGTRRGGIRRCSVNDQLCLPCSFY